MAVVDSDPIPWSVSSVGHLEGLTLESGGAIKILTSGYYFIYAQVSLCCFLLHSSLGIDHVIWSCLTSVFYYLSHS